CGSAQNSNTHGSASSAASLSEPMKPSISPGSAEASQTAPDFIARGPEIEVAAGSGSPGSLFAECFDICPFPNQILADFAQVPDGRLGHPGLPRRAGLERLDRGLQVRDRQPEQLFREPHDIVRDRVT